jgi:hypothetical protein
MALDDAFSLNSAAKSKEHRCIVPPPIKLPSTIPGQASAERHAAHFTAGENVASAPQQQHLVRNFLKPPIAPATGGSIGSSSNSMDSSGLPTAALRSTDSLPSLSTASSGSLSVDSASSSLLPRLPQPSVASDVKPSLPLEAPQLQLQNAVLSSQISMLQTMLTERDKRLASAHYRASAAEAQLDILRNERASLYRCISVIESAHAKEKEQLIAQIEKYRQRLRTPVTPGPSPNQAIPAVAGPFAAVGKQKMWSERKKASLSKGLKQGKKGDSKKPGRRPGI